MIRLAKGFLFLFAFTLCLSAHDSALAAYPTKPIEFIVPFTAGGSSDIFARAIAKIVADNKLSPQPIAVVNKPGGSAIVGFSYVAQQKNPYIITMANPSYFLIHLLGKSPVSYRDFDQVALVCQDARVMIVSKNSPFKNVKDVVQAVTAPGGKKLNVGGVGVRNDDSLCFYGMKDALKANTDYVPFTGAAEVITAVMGGHVDFAFLGLSAVRPQIDSGEVSLLAVATPKRLSTMPDVPTLTESGIPMALTQYRGVVVAKDTDKEVIAFLEDMLKKMTETQDWKDFTAKSDLVPMFMGNEEFTKVTPQICADYEKYLSLLPPR